MAPNGTDTKEKKHKSHGDQPSFHHYPSVAGVENLEKAMGGCIRVLSGGNCFGERSVASQGHYEYSVITREECVMAVVSRGEYKTCTFTEADGQTQQARQVCYTHVCILNHNIPYFSTLTLGHARRHTRACMPHTHMHMRLLILHMHARTSLSSCTCASLSHRAHRCWRWCGGRTRQRRTWR